MSPRFNALTAASPRASAAAKASSRKRDTKCELALRSALRKIGIHYRVSFAKLPGRPDVVLPGRKIAVFCDGDFWHGRNLQDRLAKLGRGHNAPYWVAKISRNVARDREQEHALAELGWRAVRLWETDILKNPHQAALRVAEATRPLAAQAGMAVPPTDSQSKAANPMDKKALPPIAALQKHLLEALRGLGGAASNEQLARTVAQACELTEAQLQVLHAPGKGSRTEFEYRMAWARTKLKLSGAIVALERKKWRLA